MLGLELSDQSYTFLPLIIVQLKQSLNNVCQGQVKGNKEKKPNSELKTFKAFFFDFRM